MRSLLIAVIAMISISSVPADAVSAKHHAARSRRQNHRTHRRPNAKWDRGYTYGNPYGLPRGVTPTTPLSPGSTHKR